VPLLIAVAVVCLCQQPAVAQQPPPDQNALSILSRPDWQTRLDLFQLILAQRGVRLTDSADDVLSRPRESIIILTGDLERVPSALRMQLQNFLQRGGAVVAASDFDAVLPDLFTIQSGPVLVADESLAYEGFDDCPRITGLNPDHPLMTGVEELIANRCGWIGSVSLQLGEWQSAASLPRQLKQRRDTRRMKSLIATVETGRSGGRLAVLADHSLLISGMLLHGDNAIFAVNLTRWLFNQRRRQALILVHGELVQGGMPKLTPNMPLPNLAGEPPALDMTQLPEESLLEFANNFVTGLQQANAPNELATGFFSSLRQPYYFRFLYFAAAICAAIWLLRQLLHRGIEHVAPQARLSGPLSWQRVQAMLNSDDYRIAAREMSRDLFRQLTGSDAVRDWPLAFSELQVDGTFPQKLSVARNLSLLRRLATGDSNRWLSRRRFLRLTRTIDNLIAMHSDGRLNVRTNGPESEHQQATPTIPT
jgi:hypothetical protein